MTGLTVAATVVLLGLAGCGNTVPTVSISATTEATSVGEVGNQPRAVGPDEFAAEISGDRLLVNVHVPYEGDIVGTDLRIPFDQIASQVGRLPSDRSTPIAVYCLSGRMSRIASETLTDLGYTDVVDLDGGMQGWQESGRRLVWG